MLAKMQYESMYVCMYVWFTCKEESLLKSPSEESI